MIHDDVPFIVDFGSQSEHFTQLIIILLTDFYAAFFEAVQVPIRSHSLALQLFNLP